MLLGIVTLKGQDVGMSDVAHSHSVHDTSVGYAWLYLNRRHVTVAQSGNFVGLLCSYSVCIVDCRDWRRA